MRKAYILAHSTTLGSVEQVKAWLNEIPQIIHWRRDLPYCFYLISEASAQDLAKALRVKASNKGRFIISEVTSNKQGWLTSESWYMLNNKRHKPKKD